MHVDIIEDKFKIYCEALILCLYFNILILIFFDKSIQPFTSITVVLIKQENIYKDLEEKNMNVLDLQIYLLDVRVKV